MYEMKRRSKLDFLLFEKNELRINRDEFDSSFFQNKQKKIAIF
jgi:hypothetical protein